MFPASEVGFSGLLLLTLSDVWLLLFIFLAAWATGIGVVGLLCLTLPPKVLEVPEFGDDFL